MTSRRLMRSSTRRKRPSVSATAATVMSGVRAMEAIIAASIPGLLKAPAVPARWSLTSARDAQAVLGRAGVPHGIELLQVDPGDGRIVDIRDAVPRVRAHSIH